MRLLYNKPMSKKRRKKQQLNHVQPQPQNLPAEKINFTPLKWILFIVFVIYLPTLFFDFTYFDDNTLILNNITFLRNLGNIFAAFQMDVFHLPQHSASYYRPLLTLSFMFDSLISNTSAWFYHVSNILIHMLSVSSLFILLKKLNYSQKLVTGATLLFAIHPVLTQAVAWIPGRNDSLAALFVFTTFIFLITYLKEAKTRDLWYYLLFTTLALFTKETALIMGPIFYAYIFLFEPKKRFAKETFILASGWIGSLLFWFILRQLAIGSASGYTISTILQSGINNWLAVFLFIGKIIIPINLSVLPIFADSNLWIGVLITFTLLLITIFFSTKNWSKITFGLLWFLAFLLPSFIRPNPDVIADFLEHRAYIPLFGIIIILAEIRIPVEALKNEKVQKWTFGIVASLFALITLIHSFSFTNRLTFWEKATKTSPHAPLAHRNYGVMLYFEGRIDEAITQYNEALTLNPQEEMAHNNLGVIYMNNKEFEKAEIEYLSELENNPFYDNALFNLGLTYYQQDEFEKALDYWRQTIEINPGYSDAYNYTLIYYINQKDEQKINETLALMQKNGIPLHSEIKRQLQPAP